MFGDVREVVDARLSSLVDVHQLVLAVRCLRYCQLGMVREKVNLELS